VLPHLLPLLLSQFLICIPACLVAEANLGTLGLGISEPLPSWGSMLLSLGNTAALSGSAWVYLPVVLLVTVLILLELLVFEV
jgi:peptide/nickel transport system permease protein